MQSIQIVPDLVHWTPVSMNSKTGMMPVSTSQRKTCPPSCPMQSSCYAKSGPLNLHWQRLDAGSYGISYPEFYSKIKQLPRGQIWRMNQAGDFKGTNNRIDAESLESITKANSGRKGFGYSHYPVMDSPHAAHNREAIRKANEGGFTVNLSANTVAQADEYKKMGVAPVVCVVPSGSPQSFISPAGHKVVLCPAQTRDNVTCSSCQLCAKSQRGAAIGFLPHGAGAKRADAVAKGVSI